MKTFRFEATVIDPPSLTAGDQEALLRRLNNAGITAIRVHEDAEGRTSLSFPVEAANDRQALDKGREMASSALADHPVVWTVGGITFWVDE